jgi:hypothetical protein
MAPELANKMAIGTAADLWSAGVVLKEFIEEVHERSSRLITLNFEFLTIKAKAMRLLT